jgi:hypothetical protein
MINMVWMKTCLNIYFDIYLAILTIEHDLGVKPSVQMKVNMFFIDYEPFFMPCWKKVNFKIFKINLFHQQI